jgi:hypothetical protein
MSLCCTARLLTSADAGELAGTMSSPPLPTQFTFKVPQPRDSPQVAGFQSNSTSYSSSLGRSFGNAFRQDPGEHIIPGGDFDGFSSSPAPRSSHQREQQSIWGTNSLGPTRYQTSATRGHQQSDSIDSKMGSFDAPSAGFIGMAITMNDRPGSYQPPDTHPNMMPSTPVPIPSRVPPHSSQSWEARNPPPLSSASSAAYTTAMTPSTGRQVMSYPTMGFHIKNSYDSPPSWHLDPPSYHQQPQQQMMASHVYTTPTPTSRRPAHLMTTPSSAPMGDKFKFLPPRQLPGSISQPHFILPAPTNMVNANGQALPASSPPTDDGPSHRHWPTSSDIFMAQYENSFDPLGRPIMKRSLTARPSKEHRCPTCHKVFARPSALQTHQAVHTGAKRESVSATEVAVAFGDADDSRSTSLPSSAFQCPILSCGKRFSVLSNMRRHVRVS